FVGVNLMFNALLDCCAWGGGWYMELDGVYKYYRMTWEPPWGYANQGVIGHEMGHGFGLPHSSGTYGQTYDNQWDVMSDVWSNCTPHATYGCLGQHTISYHKDRLGWVAEEKRYVVTSGSQATVVLEQLALPQSDNYLLVQVPIDPSGTRFYTAEARRWQGYDVKLPGQAVIIHEVDIYRSRPANVIDADGNGNTGDAGAMWLPGETFVDATEGITIHVLSATTTGFVIGIDTRPLPLAGVGLSGPTQGLVGQSYLFEAEATPATASQPITYTWQATDHPPLVHSGGLTDSAVLSWTTSGPKSVVVTATNRAGQVQASTSLPIYGTPQAAFASSSPDWLGQTTTFTNTTLGLAPISFAWDLGDGTTSTSEHPSHAYATPGLYTVCMTATNPGGSDVISDVVTAYGPPTADLAAKPVAGDMPLTVVFTATATTVPPGDPTLAYAWDFGDGGTSWQVAPSHTYTTAGVYTVRLVVENAAGSETVTRTDYITVVGVYRVYLPIVLRQGGGESAGGD
ncbi:MAG: PKD domain-containing protein, partial [Anaerolineae bacterium]